MPATSAKAERRRVPEVVEFDPSNHATDIDPVTGTLRVTFNMPMGARHSWTGGGEYDPADPEGERPRWSQDGRTCILPVSLQTSHEYRLGLNSTHHINFQSNGGVPLPPVEYKFATRSE